MRQVVQDAAAHGGSYVLAHQNTSELQYNIRTAAPERRSHRSIRSRLYSPLRLPEKCGELGLKFYFMDLQTPFLL
jgi:hypothetical protein